MNPQLRLVRVDGLKRGSGATGNFSGKTGTGLLEPNSFRQRTLKEKLANIDAKDRRRLLFDSRTIKGIAHNSDWLRALVPNFRAVENWLEMSKVELGLHESANAIFRDGTVMRDVNAENFYLYEAERFLRRTEMDARLVGDLLSIVARYTDGAREMQFQLGPGSICAINETFAEGVYEWAKPWGSMVLDIGANVGDTAVYFSLMGAARVYAVEPYPRLCELARENVKINRMPDGITIVNAAVGASSGIMTVDPGFLASGNSELEACEHGTPIEILTLADLAERYRLEDAILKIDCEGGEYGAILSSSIETLRKFRRIIAEYHAGYRNLAKKLYEAGFDVEVDAASYGYNQLSRSHYLMGMLRAERKE